MMVRTILVVDEATRTRKLLASVLSMKGYDVFEAGDGRDALERAQILRPDLVIVEAMLPYLSGFEVCNALRRNPETRAIPILMMCSLTRNLVRDDGAWRDHVPADEFITRPFGVRDLLTRIDKLIGSRSAPALST